MLVTNDMNLRICQFGRAIGVGNGLARYSIDGNDPSLILDFPARTYAVDAQRKTLAQSLTFTRAGTATYFGSDGLLKTAAANEPRLDYNPVTLQPRGLLIEGARTNLLTYSSEFGNVSWSKTNCNITGNALASSSGIVDADLVVADASVDTARDVRRNLLTTPPNQSLSLSLEISAADARYALLSIRNRTSAGNSVNAEFDLVTGVISIPAYNLGTGAGARAKITNLGGGKYRCSVSGVPDTAGTETTIVVSFRKTSGINPVASGTNLAYIAAVQLEAGAYATSYIPTTTAAVTRAADSAIMTGAGFSSWFNPVEGTFVVDFSTITTGLNNTGGNDFEFLYDLDNSAALTSGHSLIASAAYGPGVRAQTQIAGVEQTAMTSAVTLGTGATIRHAYAYKANDFASSLNGGTVQTDASGSLPTPNQMAIGSQNSGGSNHFDGHIRRIRYWPNRLSNALLQEATA